MDPLRGGNIISFHSSWQDAEKVRRKGEIKKKKVLFARVYPLCSLDHVRCT